MQIEIEGDDLVLRLPPEVLKPATEHCPLLEHFNEANNAFEHPTITSIEKWRKAVAAALNEEAEDGSTPLTRAFDKAFVSAIENGAEGIRIPGILD